MKRIGVFGLLIGMVLIVTACGESNKEGQKKLRLQRLKR